MLHTCLSLFSLLSIFQQSYARLYNNDDAALLDQLLSNDYQNPDYSLMYLDLPQDLLHRDLPRHQQHSPDKQLLARPQHHHQQQQQLDLHPPKKNPDDPLPSQLHKLQFPVLSSKMKQFAVSPAYPEYYGNHPDFLKFRLQELEEGVDAQKEPAKEGHDYALEEQLQSMIVQPEEEQIDAKRSMLRGAMAEPLISHIGQEDAEDDLYFTSIIAVCAAASVFAVIGVGFCYHRSAKRSGADQDEVEYPAYGVTGPAKECSPAGDRKLAQSAQMYHYQHQKNQMIAINRSNGGPGGNQGLDESDGEGEVEGEEGDYTVYECPGLASTDEMEVKNPLFNDDPTPKNP